MSMFRSSRSIQTRHPILTALAAGLVAGAVSSVTDRLFDRLVSKEHKKRDRRVREAPAHKMAGPYFAQKLSGKPLSEQAKKRSRLVFGLLYGLGWGLIHGKLRGRYPRLSRLCGSAFGLPFFFACDGLIAPLLKISPSLRRIPWQMSVKELGNHVAWSATAEVVHRLASRKR